MKISKNMIPHIITGILFCIAFVLTPVYSPEFSRTINLLYFPLAMFIYVVVSYGLFKLKDSRKMIVCETKTDKNMYLLFLHYFLPVFIVGSIYLFIFFPGTCMNDTIYIIINGRNMISQHPWIYWLALSLIEKLVTGFGGGYTLVLFFLSFFQLLLCATTLAISLVWLRKHGLKKMVTHMILCVYCLCPIFNLYMITIIKDVPFALLLVSWTLFLYDCWETKGEVFANKLYLIISCLLIFLSLLRNNGLYITVLILCGLSIVCGRRYYKQLLLLFFALVITFSIDKIMLKHFRVEHLFKETIGIPLQQMAATVSDDGILSVNEKAFLNNIMPLDDMKKQYDPYSADSLKWSHISVDDKFLNDNKMNVIRNWTSIGSKNPGIYIKAYLKATYGFWALDNTQKKNQAYYGLPEGFEDWYEKNNVNIQNTRAESVAKSGVFVSLNEGTLFWLFMILVSAICLRKGISSIIIATPILGNWLSLMVSTPIAFQLRYVLSIMIAIPLLFGMLLLNSELNENRYKQ